MNEIVFRIAGAGQEEELQKILSSRYSMGFREKGRNDEIYFDTFDWRLFNNNLILVYSDSEFTLKEYVNNKKIARDSSKNNLKKYFPNTFKSEVLRKSLSNLIQLRALIPICSCKKGYSLFKLMNEDQKTIAILSIEELVISNDLNKSFTEKIFHLSSIKGYDKEFEKIEKIIIGLGLTVLHRNYLAYIYEHFGREPGAYSAKVSIRFLPDMFTSEAVRIILSKLVDIIIECEAGIKKDIDIEFLHDYRVSVRKARVILSELKSYLPESVTAEFKQILIELGNQTNQLRDLDVYMLKKATYESYLPEVLKKELNPLFDQIKKERQSTFRKLKRYLNSETYKNNVLQLGYLLEEDYVSDSERGKHGVLNVSKNVILKRYKKILKTGRTITSKSKDEELHELRLDCKKLRYLLELFASLYEESKINFLITQLKMLQDNLGDFNDLSVQQEKMELYLKNYKGNSKGEINLASVIGGLITSVHRKQLEARETFYETFRKFDSKENKKVIKDLFTISRDGK